MPIRRWQIVLGETVCIQSFVLMTVRNDRCATTESLHIYISSSKESSMQNIACGRMKYLQVMTIMRMHMRIMF
jgi:hypothetical protein